MKEVEKRARARKKKVDLQKTVLGAIGVAGVLTVAAVAPNALALLKNYTNKSRFASRSSAVLTRLSAKGLITFVTKSGVRYVRLTEKGERVFELEKVKHGATEKKRRWDGQWRMVIFDIPEKNRRVRDRLRTEMRDIGFFLLQGSVWVYPYDCEDLLALLKAELKQGVNVLYAVVSALENDKRVRQHFKLPSA